MFDEFICPIDHSRFTVSKTAITCKKHGHIFTRRGNFINLWAETGETDAYSKSIIRRELKFSHKLSGDIKNGLINQNDQGKIELLARDQGLTYAAQKIDSKARMDLFSLLPPDVSKLKILDVGAGLGKEAVWLNTVGADNLFLTDISADFLKFACKKSRYTIAIQANAEHLPFKSDSFDLVIFGSALHHMPHPFRALTEATRVGKIVAAFGEPSTMFELNRLIQLIGWNTEYADLRTRRINPGVLADFFHTHQFNPKIKTDYIWFPSTYFPGIANNKIIVNGYFKMLHLLDRIFPRYGHNITFAAYKNIYRKKQ
jgi:ubiquinone/menaquinone biosynthesis C-methylase UbiE